MHRFGEKLRKLRTHHGMTARELAVSLGYTAYSNSYISLIESGKRRPSLNFVLRAAHFFNVSAEHLTRDELEVAVGGELDNDAKE